MDRSRMAHAASQLKKRADENLTAAEDEKEKKKAARKRSREAKKKVEKEEGGKGRGVWREKNYKTAERGKKRDSSGGMRTQS